MICGKWSSLCSLLLLSRSYSHSYTPVRHTHLEAAQVNHRCRETAWLRGTSIVVVMGSETVLCLSLPSRHISAILLRWSQWSQSLVRSWSLFGGLKNKLLETPLGGTASSPGREGGWGGWGDDGFHFYSTFNPTVKFMSKVLFSILRYLSERPSTAASTQSFIIAPLPKKHDRRAEICCLI